MLESGGFNYGYLLKAKSPGIQSSFATANLAVRREVLLETGGFDENCVTGEDFDLNLRVLNTKWECYYEHRAKIQHRFRDDIVSLFKQWYDYSYYHPYVLKKNMKPGIEIYVPFTLSYTEVLRIPFPVYVLLRLSSFYLFHFFLILTVLTPSGNLNKISIAATVLFGMKQFFIPFSFKKPAEALCFVLLRYMVNIARFTGGFFGGLGRGMLFFEETWNTNVIPEKVHSQI
jgi:cellulose synthase/poly-beta-1,6-N-acetylglucosamine synthase-like glycosyltransferase